MAGNSRLHGGSLGPDSSRSDETPVRCHDRQAIACCTGLLSLTARLPAVPVPIFDRYMSFGADGKSESASTCTTGAAMLTTQRMSAPCEAQAIPRNEPWHELAGTALTAASSIRPPMRQPVWRREPCRRACLGRRRACAPLASDWPFTTTCVSSLRRTSHVADDSMATLSCTATPSCNHCPANGARGRQQAIRKGAHGCATRRAGTIWKATAEQSNQRQAAKPREWCHA